MVCVVTKVEKPISIYILPSAAISIAPFHFRAIQGEREWDTKKKPINTNHLFLQNRSDVDRSFLIKLGKVWIKKWKLSATDTIGDIIWMRINWTRWALLSVPNGRRVATTKKSILVLVSDLGDPFLGATCTLYHPPSPHYVNVVTNVESTAYFSA